MGWCCSPGRRAEFGDIGVVMGEGGCVGVVMNVGDVY